jgi:predicted DNA-binding transcriptional regulator AlpA
MPNNEGMETPNTSVTSEKPLATTKPWTVVGISRAQWFKLSRSGRTPLPTYLGARRPVYLLAELQAWLEAGAPNREAWQRMRGAKR